MNSILLQFYYKGFGVGLIIATIIGPVSILCINKTLTIGRKAGFAIGLGAALADATYGLIAGFGLTLLSNFLLEQKTLFSIIGGCFILFMGIKTFLEKPNTKKVKKPETKFFKTVSSIYFLTLANPITIFSFMAIFAGVGLGSNINSYLPMITLVFGVFCGTMVWYSLLIEALVRFFNKVNYKTILMLNKISGIGFIAFALSLFISLIVHRLW